METTIVTRCPVAYSRVQVLQSEGYLLVFTAWCYLIVQVSMEQVDKIADLVKSGVSQGAKLGVGGGKMDGNGFFFQPTIFSDVTDDMRIFNEEVNLSLPHLLVILLYS